MTSLALDRNIGKDFIWVDVQNKDVEKAKKWCMSNCTKKYSFAFKIHEEYNMDLGFVFSSPSDATLFKMVWQ